MVGMTLVPWGQWCLVNLSMLKKYTAGLFLYHMAYCACSGSMCPPLTINKITRIPQHAMLQPHTSVVEHGTVQFLKEGRREVERGNQQPKGGKKVVPPSKSAKTKASLLLPMIVAIKLCLLPCER